MLKRTNHNFDQRRNFTREEDEWIVAYSQGQLSQSMLMSRLRCGTETLERRAFELGVTMRKYNGARGQNAVKAKPRILRDENGEVLSGYQEVPHVGEDLLLQRLQSRHGDRRYNG